MFNVFLSGTDSGIKSTLSKFADDTEMSSADDLLDGWGVIQMNLERLEESTHVNLIKFNKAKHKVLHMDEGNLQYWYRLGDEMIGAAL